MHASTFFSAGSGCSELDCHPTTADITRMPEHTAWRPESRPAWRGPHAVHLHPLGSFNLFSPVAYRSGCLSTVLQVCNAVTLVPLHPCDGLTMTAYVHKLETA